MAAPRPLRSVAVLLHTTARALEVSALGELFGGPRGAGPRFELTFAAAKPGEPVHLLGAGTVTPQVGLAQAIDADLVFVAPPVDVGVSRNPELSAVIRAVAQRGGLLMSADTGVFLLAEAGVLDGRLATTHWRLVDQFRGSFPQVRLAANALYVDDDPVHTAAGGAATIDACLHLVGKHLGTAAANALSRQVVVGAHRSGWHNQVLARPVPRRRDDGIAELLQWAAANLHEELSVERLARRTFMSRRSFARRFRAATGATPYAWLLEQRVRCARELLEDPSGPSVEEVAARVGFGTAATLRQHFRRAVGCTPTEYRERFAHHRSVRSDGPSSPTGVVEVWSG